MSRNVKLKRAGRKDKSLKINRITRIMWKNSI